MTLQEALNLRKGDKVEYLSADGKTCLYSSKVLVVDPDVFMDEFIFVTLSDGIRYPSNRLKRVK